MECLENGTNSTIILPMMHVFPVQKVSCIVKGNYVEGESNLFDVYSKKQAKIWAINAAFASLALLVVYMVEKLEIESPVLHLKCYHVTNDCLVVLPTPQMRCYVVETESVLVESVCAKR